MPISRIILFITMLGLMASGTTSAETDIIYRPEFKYNLGYTDYTLKVSNGSVYVRSTLEFPTDAALFGQTLGVAVSDLDGPLWEFTLTGFLNLNQRGGTMTDSDWSGSSPALMTLFSYTESSVAKNHLIWEAEVSRRILTFTRASLEINAGYRFHRMSTDIFGVEGWQLVDDGTGITRYDFNQDGHFLYYRVTYNMPYVGANYDLSLDSDLNLGFEADLAAVFASDYDDHFARYKFSKAEGLGGAVLTSAAIELFPTRTNRFKLSLFGEFDYIYVPASQRQEWYGDDPASEDFDDTGRVISNIDYEFDSWQFNAGFRIHLLF